MTNLDKVMLCRFGKEPTQDDIEAIKNALQEDREAMYVKHHTGEFGHIVCKVEAILKCDLDEILHSNKAENASWKVIICEEAMKMNVDRAIYKLAELLDVDRSMIYHYTSYIKKSKEYFTQREIYDNFEK